MIKQKKNKIYTSVIFIILVSVFYCFIAEVNIAKAAEATGCCMYKGGEGGCVDGWTKAKCGGEEGAIGAISVQWKEAKFCKKIDACIANNNDNPIKLSVPIGGVREIKDLSEYIRTIYTWSIGAIAAISVVMIMIAGFQWLNAVGNEKAIGDAKTRIKNAIFGLTLVASSYLLLQIVNPDTLNLKFPGVLRVAPVIIEADSAKVICDPDKYPEVPCGSTKITEDIYNPVCMGALCDTNAAVCLLEFTDTGDIVMGDGCVSKIYKGEFLPQGSKAAQKTETKPNIKVSMNKKCGEWKYGNALNAVVPAAIQVYVGGIIPQLIAPLAAVNAMLDTEMHLGADCNIGSNSDSCYYMRKRGGVYSLIEDAKACCTGDEDCFNKVRNSFNFKTQAEKICEGEYDIDFTKKQLCGEYFFDPTDKCLWGAVCGGSLVNTICSRENRNSVPMCINHEGNLISGMDEMCGESYSQFDDGGMHTHMGMRCGFGADDSDVCVLEAGKYKCVAK